MEKEPANKKLRTDDLHRQYATPFSDLNVCQVSVLRWTLTGLGFVLTAV
jgi:hypothetical protein